MRVKWDCDKCIQALRDGMQILHDEKDLEILEYTESDGTPNGHIWVREAKCR